MLSKYAGHLPCCTECMMVHNLSWIFQRIGSQWSCDRWRSTVGADRGAQIPKADTGFFPAQGMSARPRTVMCPERLAHPIAAPPAATLTSFVIRYTFLLRISRASCILTHAIFSVRILYVFYRRKWNAYRTYGRTLLETDVLLSRVFVGG